MTFQESLDLDRINSILDKVNSNELKLFPSTRNRLMQIVTKLQKQELLSESDFDTLNLNNL